MRTRLDLLAAVCTGSSTVCFATSNLVPAWCLLLAGSCLWLVVALRGRFEGRRIWGQVVSSVWTMAWSVIGLWHSA